MGVSLYADGTAVDEGGQGGPIIIKFYVEVKNYPHTNKINMKRSLHLLQAKSESLFLVIPEPTNKP